MKQFWLDFKKFITRGNVVDMAVGVTVASAFTAIVTAFTKGFITPLLALLTNDSDLTEMKWIIRPEVSETLEDGTVNIITAEVSLLWGAFLQKIIDFLIIALVLFIVMRVASGIMARYAKVRQDVVEALTDVDEKARAEAERIKAEEEAKAQAEAEAKAKAEEEERLAKEAELKAIEEEKTRLKTEVELLTEIRDLLKAKQ